MKINEFKYQKAYEHLLGEELFVKPDGQVQVRCMFHDDKDPSLSINVGRGVFKCFAGCGHGNFESFLDLYVRHSQKADVDVTPMINEARELAGLSGDVRCFLSYKSKETPLTYYIEKVLGATGGLKVILKVLHQGKLLFTDIPNLSAAKKRTECANKIHGISGCDFYFIEQDLIDLEKRCRDKLIEQEKHQEEIHEQPLTEEELRLAQDFLEQNDLIKQIQQDIKRIGVIGEETSSILLYLTCTSRMLKNPISLVIKGPSSAGKSHLLKKVLSLMPTVCVKKFTYLSAKALFYMKKNSLKNCILVIEERPGAEASDYSIRVLQSENGLRIGSVIKDEATGKHSTEDKEIEGPIAYVETTTYDQIHAENETRTFSLYADNSEEQTKRVHAQLKLPYKLEESGLAKDIDQIIKKHKAAQQLLKLYAVKIPFVDSISLPSTKVRSRRDMARLLALIEVSALLHQYQREKKMVGGEECIIASIQDYEVAYTVAHKILAETLLEIPPASRKLLKDCEKLDQLFTRQEIQKATGWSLDDVKKWVEPLLKYGYLTRVSGRKGQYYQYRISKQISFEHSQGIMTPDQLKQKLKVDQQQLNTVVKGLSKKLSLPKNL